MKFLKRRKKQPAVVKPIPDAIIVETDILPVRLDKNGVMFSSINVGGKYDTTLRLRRGEENTVGWLKDNELGFTTDTKKLAIRHGDTVFLVPVRIIADSADGAKNK